MRSGVCALSIVGALVFVADLSALESPPAADRTIPIPGALPAAALPRNAAAPQPQSQATPTPTPVATRQKEDKILFFYHGTDEDSARSIMATGIQNKGSGQEGRGFYTFQDEALAFEFASLRAAPWDQAVVRLAMTQSLYERLRQSGGVIVAPWHARAGTGAVPGIQQIIFTPQTGLRSVSWTDRV